MKTLFSLAVVGVILWGIYSAAMAVKSYFEISNVVEEVVPRVLEAGTESHGTFAAAGRTERVRTAIVNGAAKSGIALEPDSVSVTEDEGAMWVRVTSSYRALKVGDRVIDIPISSSRSFALAGRQLKGF
jgi:hypothetical protein